jgi:predicted transglutaminase-like cysteine proteinase
VRVGCPRSQSHWGLKPAAIWVSLAIGLLPGGTGAQAQSAAIIASTAPVPVSEAQAQPTRAWLAFCKRLPAECAVDSREIEIIQLTPSVWRLLSETTERVNASIRSVSDRDHWGVADRWDYPDDGAGDCEDIQLLKRKLLSAAGLPRRALRMTVVYDEHQTGHAVLMVRTDRGDLILDNRTNAVLPWGQTGYDFVKREGDGPDWVQLSPRAAPTATAESAQ